MVEQTILSIGAGLPVVVVMLVTVTCIGFRLGRRIGREYGAAKMMITLASSWTAAGKADHA
ncbi:hypothetical protein AU374_06007 [Cupriavidus metallidurans]|nr:hypothetical protein AU374_06007 [Cupriavidus metallidurans]